MQTNTEPDAEEFERTDALMNKIVNVCHGQKLNEGLNALSMALALFLYHMSVELGKSRESALELAEHVITAAFDMWAEEDENGDLAKHGLM